MSFWLWLVIGLFVGAAPSRVAEVRLRPALARQWWWVSFGIAFVCLILPCGIVLIMFLSDLAFEAIAEMGRLFWHDEFRWLTGLACGWLTGSGAAAWIHRKAPRLQGPPMSEQAMTLARDPDKHWHAIQLYRQEAAVGIVVATDVVESYIASQRALPAEPGATDRSRLGALEWMYVGFTAAWYVVLCIGFGFSLRSPGNHFITALAFFLFIPGLFGGFCGICLSAVSARVKAALREALQGGTCTRGFAFSAGLAAGVVSIAGVLIAACAAYSLSHSEVGVMIGLVGIGVVLTASPFLGLWMLKKKTAL